MKTLTEFSGVVLKAAHKARDERVAAGVEAEALAAAVGEALGIGGDRAERLLEALDAAGADLDQIRLVRVYQGEAAPPGAKTIGEFHYVLDRVAVRPASRGRPGRGAGAGRGGGRGGDRGAGRGGERRGAARAEGAKREGRFSLEGGPRGEGRRGEKMPSGGAGWTLTRAPREGRDRDEDRRKRKPPRRKRPPGEGAKPPARRQRNGRPSEPGGAPAAERALPDKKPPRRPRRGRGPKPGTETKEPVVEVLARRSVALTEAEGGPKRKRKRKRKRGRRGQAAPETAAAAESSELGPPTGQDVEPKAAPRRRRIIASSPGEDSGSDAPARSDDRGSDAARSDDRGSDAPARSDDDSGSDVPGRSDDRGSDAPARSDDRGSDAPARSDDRGSDVPARSENRGAPLPPAHAANDQTSIQSAVDPEPSSET